MLLLDWHSIVTYGAKKSGRLSSWTLPHTQFTRQRATSQTCQLFERRPWFFCLLFPHVEPSFWDLFDTGLSHQWPYRGLWIYLWVCREEVRVKTRKGRCGWGLKGRKIPPAMSPSGLWGCTSILIQLVPSSILFFSVNLAAMVRVPSILTFYV